MQQVLTLVAGTEFAGLDNSILDRLRSALETAGAQVSKGRWLASKIAADIPFTGVGLQDAEAVARTRLGPVPVDLVVQAEEGRRKRLLLADMDSTIVGIETLDELADFAGIKERVALITERSMRGELDFVKALEERVAMLEGLSETALERTYARVFLVPGARTLVQTMRKHGAFTALISGGFRFFTSRVRELVGFDYDEANTLEVKDGHLTGRVVPPIVNRDGKFNALKRLSEERGIPMEATVAVGDGANDLEMIRAAGLGVAFHGKPAVATAARGRIDHGDLTALLYFQGYAAEEFVG